MTTPTLKMGNPDELSKLEIDLLHFLKDEPLSMKSICRKLQLVKEQAERLVKKMVAARFITKQTNGQYRNLIKKDDLPPLKKPAATDRPCTWPDVAKPSDFDFGITRSAEDLKRFKIMVEGVIPVDSPPADAKVGWKTSVLDKEPAEPIEVKEENEASYTLSKPTSLAEYEKHSDEIQRIRSNSEIVSVLVADSEFAEKQQALLDKVASVTEVPEWQLRSRIEDMPPYIKPESISGFTLLPFQESCIPEKPHSASLSEEMEAIEQRFNESPPPNFQPAGMDKKLSLISFLHVLLAEYPQSRDLLDEIQADYMEFQRECDL